MTHTKYMKHIVCFSKGHSSAIVAIEVTRRFGPENVILVNHNINPKKENQDIKRFGQQVADYLGLPITYANYSGILEEEKIPSQFDICITEGAFKNPSTGDAICTSRLKTVPFFAYLKESHPRQDCIIYYGFDSLELIRKNRRTAILGAMGWDTAYPLIDWPESERTIKETSEIGIQRPDVYSLFVHANCVGCLKAGIQHWYIVYVTRKDVWNEAKRAEEKLGYSILRNRTGGTTKPFYLKDIEPIFDRMIQEGVPATEHYPKGKFNAALQKHRVDVPSDNKPCECSF